MQKDDAGLPREPGLNAESAPLPPDVRAWECGQNDRVLPLDDAMAYAQKLVAAERERLAQVVRDFPHWIGPRAKTELLQAMSLAPNTEGEGRHD